MHKHDYCTFSHPGTFNHECGKPATQVGVKYSKETHNGIFYAKRCEHCATIKGGENNGMLYFEPYNPATHLNKWI